MIPITPKSPRRASPTNVSARRQAATARIGGGCLLLASLAFASLAQAQCAPASSDSLTWNGITLYGIIDVGVQYDTHSAPFSDYFPPGSNSIIQKNGYDSPVGLTPSNLSQSKIGLSGNEPLLGDWAAIFRLETFFNPQSGNLSDGIKAVALNNGKPITSQVSGVDTSVAGQIFSGAAYAGIASPTYGSFTFGRNVTLLADGISKYDPMNAAQAFSLIGFSGTAAGGGDTEDRRLDQSLKYYLSYGGFHAGALYQFGGSSGSTNTGYQLQLGGEYAGFSADAYYFKKYNAISVSSLSAAQVTTAIADGFSVTNAVSGTISDNQTWMITALYNFGDVVPLKLYGGYEHITFDNPNNPLAVGSLIIGGYTLAVVNNAAYNNNKILQVYWAGFRYSITKDLDFVAAYYGYNQNSYATGAHAGCTDNSNSACSGTEAAVSGLFDYRLSRRFDVYFGSMWSGVRNGLANGYYATNNIATTAGVRFKF
jgi:predicted porin